MTTSDAKNIVTSFLSASTPTQTQRLNDFLRYEDFADGKQWKKDEEPEGTRPKLTFNQTADYINVYLSKIIPRNPLTGNTEVGVRVVEKDLTKKEKYEQEILTTYDREFLPLLLLEQIQNFLVGGAGCLYYPFDPVSRQTRIISLDPKYCFLGWADNQLVQFAFQDEVTLADVPKSNTGMVAAIKQYITRVLRAGSNYQSVTRTTYWNNSYQIIVVGDFVEIRKNDKGFIPFSWIPNQPKSHRHEGRSDVKPLMHIDREYNFRASDFGARVKENTRPNLATFSELDVDKLSRDDKGILALGKDDDAKYLTVPEERTALVYLDTLEKRMRFKMGINDAVLGEMRSNVSSAAMTYYFSPLLDRIALKRVFWDRAFREMNSAILAHKFGPGEYSAAPIYHSPLTIDAGSNIDNVVKLLSNRLISYTDAIDQLRGAENSETKLAAIKKEVMELEKIPGFFQKNNSV